MKGLVILEYTTQYYKSKRDLLRGLASEEKFDFIAITETWLDSVLKYFAT